MTSKSSTPPDSPPPPPGPRLSQASLAAVRPGVAVPAYDRSQTRVGVVHFGPGAFHRAHQADYFDRLLADDPRWAICEVAPNSAAVFDALAPQDGLYALAELDAETRWRVIGAIKEILVAPRAPATVLDRLAAPDLTLVTLTVTEKGYCLDADGTLDLDHPSIRHDLAQPQAPVSVIGWLAAGLARRRAAGLAPFVSLSCDNLAENGPRLGAAVQAFARARGEADLAAWIAGAARFPRTMVDSITPATDAALRASAAEALGLVDAWPVQRERFAQWVIEDALGPGAPDLARVGAILTSDVAGYEQAKLRLLNGAHSSLAYLGLLAGLETVGEAMADPAIAGFVRTLMATDIAPGLTPPAGLDLAAYGRTILQRFGNPRIRHRLVQIAADGSLKLPIRLLAPIADALAAGRPVARLAAPVAAWMRWLAEAARRDRPVADPLARILLAQGRRCTGRGETDTAAFLSLAAVFPADLAAAAPFRTAVRTAYDDLVAGGVSGLLGRLAAGG